MVLRSHRQLTIPCCKSCNSGPLSNLETEIAAAVSGGFDTFADVDGLRVFQWVGKLFYDLLIVEGRLPLDRASRTSQRIASSDLITEYQLLHYFLQSIRLPFEFVDFTPWSLFRFRLKPAPPELGEFDYRDDLNTLAFGLRLGEIGIVINLLDNGAGPENVRG
jgi:hypothetical protein